MTDISWEFYDKIEKFSPFGLGNPAPTFVSKDVEVIGIRQVGRERKHLKLSLQGQSLQRQGLSLNTFNAIAFSLGNLATKISPGDKIDICYCLEKNVWNGNESLELRVKDIKKSYPVC